MLVDPHGYPALVLRAMEAERDVYAAGRGQCDRTATQLIDSPRAVELKRRHDPPETVHERIAAFEGSALHAALARGSGKGDLVEERLYIDLGGWRIGGQFDWMPDEGKVLDWKFRKPGAWVWAKGKPKREDVNQLNVLAVLARHASFPVTALEVGWWFKGWDPAQAGRQPDYPQRPIIVQPIPTMTPVEAIHYLSDRVNLHQAATKLSDADLPPCTPEERWTKASAWAVTKAGNKRATAKFDTEAEALTDLRARGAGYTIVERPGEDTRCLSYCAARTVCAHGKAVAAAANPEPVAPW